LNRKEEILEAVISRFQERGFTADITLSQIALQVDIGKSTIYEYFSNKDEVFKGALLKISQDSIEEILNINNIEEMNFEEAFKTQFSKLLEVSCKSKMTFQIFTEDLIHRMPITIKEELKRRMYEVKDIMEKRFALIILKGVNEKLITVEMNSMNQLIFSSLIVGSIIRYSNSDTEILLKDFVNTIYDITIKIGS